VRWFYIKFSHWANEREWRCLRSKPGAQSFPPDALIRIIAGCVDTEATLTAVRNSISGTPLKNVRLYKAARQVRRFGLDTRKKTLHLNGILTRPAGACTRMTDCEETRRSELRLVPASLGGKMITRCYPHMDIKQVRSK
jgi:hypothetical protein